MASLFRVHTNVFFSGLFLYELDGVKIQALMALVVCVGYAMSRALFFSNVNVCRFECKLDLLWVCRGSCYYVLVSILIRLFAVCECADLMAP